MHCEKCGSADTQVVKCSKCGQKSRIQCGNCSFSSCTDKYCEVISIKRKIKILTYFAVTLIVLMVFVLPVIIMRAIEEDPTPAPTRVVQNPTPEATEEPPPPPPPPPPTATEPATPDDGGFEVDPFEEDPPPPEPSGPTPAEQRQSAASEARRLVEARLPFKSGATTPEEGGIGFAEFVAWTLGEAGVDVSASLPAMAKLGDKVRDASELQPGDVIFFSIKRNNKASFVGLALGDGKFACVYPGKSAMEIPLDHKFWKPRFLYGVRAFSE